MVQFSRKIEPSLTLTASLSDRAGTLKRAMPPMVWGGSRVLRGKAPGSLRALGQIADKPLRWARNRYQSAEEFRQALLSAL